MEHADRPHLITGSIRRLLASPLALCLISSCLYGVANYFSGKYFLPGCSFAELRPQVALPMIIGILHGPAAGFVVGAFGDMLGYIVGGKGFLFAPFWSVANGLMGLIPGLIRYWGGRPVTSILSFAKLLALLLAASSLPFMMSVGTEIAQGNLLLQDAFYKLFLPIFITDTLWAFMLVPALMICTGTMQIRIELRTILIIHYLLIFTVLVTWMCNILVTMQNDIRIEELYLLGGLTILVLIIGLGVSTVFAKKITSPLTILTEVTEQVTAGNYANVTLLRRFTSRTDEIGTLAQGFNSMIQAVEKRETDLKREVKELRIEIDHKKQEKELKKITGTDYFQQLKKKAGELRRTTSSKTKDS